MAENADRTAARDALEKLQITLEGQFRRVAIDRGVLSGEGQDLTNVTDTIDEVRDNLKESNEIPGLTESQLKTIFIATTDTANAIVSALDDLESDNYLRRLAGVLNIVASASTFLTLMPPAGPIVAVVVAPLCILTTGILKRVGKKQRETGGSSPDSVIREAVEEVKKAIKVEFFQERKAMCHAKIESLAMHLEDINDHYECEADRMEERHYDQLYSNEYMDDGETLLDQLIFYIESCLYQASTAREPHDAEQAASLIHSYVMISLIRRQELLKMMFVFERGQKRRFYEQANRRLNRRMKKDQKLLKWLLDPPDDSLNGLLYAEVVNLPPSKRSLIESFVGGKIPGQLCILCNSPWDTKRYQLEMKRAADAKLTPVSSNVDPSHMSQMDVQRDKKFIIYLSDDYASMSIFSLGGGGYLRPDEKDQYVIAGKRHWWGYYQSNLVPVLAFFLGTEKEISFPRKIFDDPCKLKLQTDINRLLLISVGKVSPNGEVDGYMERIVIDLQRSRL